MRYQDYIYIQNNNGGLKNTTSSVNTSSDFCEFNYPLFNISGGTNDISITSGVTSGSSYVHTITSGTTLDVTFDFTANTESFITSNSDFKYEVFKYDASRVGFYTPSVIQSESIAYSGFSGTSALTETLSLDSLRLDGEYLIKGYFNHDVCTDFGQELGVKNDTSLFKTGESLGLYKPVFDYYLAAIRTAETPSLQNNGDNSTRFNALRQKIYLPDEDGQTDFTLPIISGDFVVTLNGSSLSKDLDYIIVASSGDTATKFIRLSGETKTEDTVTIIYVGATNSNGLKTDSIVIESPIVSGATDGQGSENVYFNTATTKYEAFLSLPPTNTDNVLVMLNGVTLANGADFYHSTSNIKRLIFEGILKVGDVLIIAYNQAAEVVGDLNTSSPIVSWDVNNAPQLINGEFALEVATDFDMTNITTSATTPYEVGVNSYTASVTITGDVGTEMYYRIRNNKDFVLLSGGTVSSVAYSEIIPIKITTNSINAY